MLTTLIGVLLVLWVFGVVTSYTLGGFIHILLGVAIVFVLLRIIRGRNALRGQSIAIGAGQDDTAELRLASQCVPAP